MSMKNPITARRVRLESAVQCAKCEKQMDAGEMAWREINNDLDGDERGPFFLHLRCEGEDCSREEERRAMNEHLCE